MSWFKCCLVLATLLAAGCAATTAPELAESTRAPAAQADTEADAAGTAELRQMRTVPLTFADTDTSAVITCRDIRSLGSNVFVTRCMTRAGWEKYEQAQTLQAQEFLRKLRGEL